MPNVIWILLDACRAGNLSCYGYERITSPNLDALAARGALFEQHYAQSNFTARSVPSYMTGRYFAVSCLDLQGRVQLNRIPPPGERLLPDIMRENGYATAMFSAHKAFIRPGSRLWKAFDHAEDVKKKETLGPFTTFEEINDAAIPWIESHRNTPFFLYLHTVDTHRPHFLESPYNQWLDPTYDGSHLGSDKMLEVVWTRDGSPLSRADIEQLRGEHDGSIRYADHYIGALMARLDALGLRERTVIVVSADHGDAYGEDGYTVGHMHAGVADEVLHVPLIMAGPGIPEGVRIRSLTENVDIVPTLIQLLGLKTDARPDGKGLVPLMHTPNGPPLHDAIFAYRIADLDGHKARYDDMPAMLLRNGKYKYETDPTSGIQTLWAVPDSLSRRNVLWKSSDTPAPPRNLRAATQKLRRTIEEAYVSRWKEYLKLPYTDITLHGSYFVQFGKFDGEYLWGGSEDDKSLYTDNQWSANPAYLWSCAWQENAPPITVRYPLYNGRFEVIVTLIGRTEFEGHPGSSIRVRLPGDEEFRLITTGNRPPGKTEWFEPIRLGVVEVTDGEFTITIDEGDTNYWTFLYQIRLIPEGTIVEDSETTFDMLLQMIEEHRAMGYL